MMNNENLKQKVKEFIQTKLKAIKSVDDVPVHNFIIEKKWKRDALYSELGVYRKILQLTINVFNDYDTFGKFLVKFAAIDEKLMFPFDQYYDFDKNNAVWRCIKPPKNDQMEAVLLNYILCMKSLEEDEEVVEVSIEEISLEQCPYCNNPFVSKEDDCEGCSSSYNEMLEYAKKVYEDRLKFRKFKKSNGYHNVTFTKDESLKMFENDSVGSKMTNEKEFKWECFDCAYLNGYEFDNCEGCGRLYKDGIWTCGECKKENTRESNYCTKCRKKNVNVKDICDKIKEVGIFEVSKRSNDVSNEKIEKDQWKCGKCGLLQSFDFIECSDCGENRAVNGEWMCGRCTLINKCNSDKCEVCENVNCLFKKTHCANDKVSNVKELRMYTDVKIRANKYQEVKWTCKFSHCGERNSDHQNYCKKCKLYRFSSLGRGDPVKTLLNDVERSIWICSKCCLLNELTKPICNCGGMRYKKIFCHGCQRYTDGRSDKCYTCINKQ